MTYLSLPDTLSSRDAKQGVLTYTTTQNLNLARQKNAIRSFDPKHFGSREFGPRDTHLNAANALLQKVHELSVRDAARLASASPDIHAQNPDLINRLKDRLKTHLGQAEKIWDFYYYLFEQRRGPFGPKLIAADNIGLDCYQTCYMGLGAARSIPTPPPFSYIEGHRGPATFRRGVKVSKISRNPNPFPLIKLPYSRLVSPWSLGAIPHEIGHNIQNDLGLWKEGPRLIRNRLQRINMPKEVIDTWSTWHKEIYADLIGILLIGPSYVASIMDVVGRPAISVAQFSKGAVHPTPYLRILINTMLLRLIGFDQEAARYEKTWKSLYPAYVVKHIPNSIRSTFDAACKATVIALCFSEHAAYGGKRLVDVVGFQKKDQHIVFEAANRLAHGTSPGIVPDRFLISAARVALDHKLAPPDRIAQNFYDVLLGK